MSCHVRGGEGFIVKKVGNQSSVGMRGTKKWRQGEKGKKPNIPVAKEGTKDCKDDRERASPGGKRLWNA